MSCLAPCPSCSRHVDTDAAACPFCSTALPDSFRCQPARKPLRGRLSRSGLIAAGATLISIGQSCSSAYGGSVIPDAATDASTMDGSAVALYGAAPAPLEQAATPAKDTAQDTAQDKK